MDQKFNFFCTLAASGIWYIYNGILSEVLVEQAEALAEVRQFGGHDS